jgi:hypothetical protein
MDVLGVGFLVLLGLVVAAAVVRSRSRVRPQPPQEPSAAEHEVPTFRVVALGVRGSGKTLLLASMYHQLQTPSGRSYFLSAPYDQVVLLNQWYSDASDTSKAWPSGTAVGGMRDFNFTVLARMSSGAPQAVMRLNYLEYAGGLLTDVQAPGSTAQADLLGRIESAHALIGIIDGYRLRQLLDGRAEGQARLQQSLTSMINLMLLTPKPVTFVITKWDLLRDIEVDEDARLRRVRKLLMFNQGFHDLVREHNTRRVVRLVPVSALGPDFAELDDAGMVAKRPDGEVHPTNVDVPLSAVVPDVFEQVELSMDRAELRAAFDRIRRQTRIGPAASLVELGSFVAGTAMRSLGALGMSAAFVGDAASELFRSRIDDRGEDRRARLERELSEAEQRLDEFRLARRKVLRELQHRIHVLEGRLPSSRLSSED